MAWCWSISARSGVAASATVLVLGVPTGSWAITASPPAPATISLSGTGHPKCTTLKYHLNKLAPRIVLRITKGGSVYHSVKLNVPAGDRSFRWCGTRTSGQPVGHNAFYSTIFRKTPVGKTLGVSVPQKIMVVP